MKTRPFLSWLIVAVGSAFFPGSLFAADVFQVGAARVDVTPEYPIRLSGYGSRKTESEGVAQRLWAKAMAISSANGEQPAVLITVDNCGLPASMVEAVAARLARATGLKPDRFAVCSTHTHTGPCLTGILPNLFSSDIVPGEQATIDRYTRELTDHLERVGLQALRSRQPGFVSWGRGKAGFARNRRTANGPVDHDLSVLRATATNGALVAILANYACHCTTLYGEFNQAHGDWAGCAQEAIERDHPGAIGMVAVGCGADANPQPCSTLENAKQNGEEMAAEVRRLIGQHLTPLPAKLECRIERITLPFDPLPTREQWNERSQQQGIVGYHARKNLQRLDRGEKLPTELPYVVQAWNFGDNLAMVFLAGEVVVDYSLRLKKEFDAPRLWVNAYANDVPCYIPSQRILREGGYEAETSLWYYDRPVRLAPESEERIIAAVHKLVPKSFLFDARKAELPPPRTTDAALAAFETKPGLTVELVAAEPLVTSPVAIDFGADGRLWVAEMYDYPSGLDGKGNPGGRVKVLTDIDGDGRYDQARVFAEGLPFPTGLMAWRDGVLIGAAPDILYAQDKDGDGKAEKVAKLFSGFATHNLQARVNCFRWGLDNWVYGSSGLFGGKIHLELSGATIDLGQRDFRFHPDNGDFEPVHGLSQQGRVRDDAGEWFGCDNSTLLWHYPLPDPYVRRNPHIAAPDPRLYPVKEKNPNQLFPISRTLERFNDPQAANRTTSACGVEIYRDNFLGDEYTGNAFVCEPVHNLVHRLVLSPDGVTFRAHRADDEQQREFLASTDNWFRPVEARTGPEGALWVVDMYRFVVEHARWIPPDRLAKLDVRAGADMGRIYRVAPRDKRLAKVPNLTQQTPLELVHRLDTANGTLRDLVHRELLLRGDAGVRAPLERLANESRLPAVRCQALSVLDGLQKLPEPLVVRAIKDSDTTVRRHALRLAENCVRLPAANLPNPKDPSAVVSGALAAALLGAIDDPDPRVRFQAALSLGEWDDPRTGPALAKLALDSDRWIRSAVLTSASLRPVEIVQALLAKSGEASSREAILGSLYATAAASSRPGTVEQITLLVAPQNDSLPEPWTLAALVGFLDALERRKVPLDALSASSDHQVAAAAKRISAALRNARTVAADPKNSEPLRAAATRLIGRQKTVTDDDAAFLVQLLQSSGEIHQAALESLARQTSPRVGELLVASWKRLTPASRNAIVGLLVSRDAWAEKLVAAIEADTIAAAEIPAATRQRLEQHPTLRPRAAKLFAAHGGGRAEVLQRFRSIAELSGEPTRGLIRFSGLCASCHALGEQGHAVGPDLSAFRDKSVEDFLVAIIDPNAAIEPKYVNYQIETRDGRELNGIVRGENASGLTLVQPAGIEEKILRSDITVIKASKLSLMPEGLEAGLTPQDLADLIAWVKKALPAPFGSATMEQAAKARATFLRVGVNGLARLLSASEQLTYPSWLGALPLAHCRQTDGSSRVEWQTQPVPAEFPKDGWTFRLPVAMGYLSQPSGNFVLHVDAKSALEFDVSLEDRTWQTDDGSLRMIYSVAENNREDSNGILLIEVAARWLRPGAPVTFTVTASAAKSQRWFGIYLAEPTGTAMRSGK